MARSTFRKQQTDFDFGHTDSEYLPPISVRVSEGPFSLSDYFTVAEAEQMRDELTAAIDAAKAKAEQVEAAA